MSVAGWVLGSLRNGGKYQVTVLVGYARLYLELMLTATLFISMDCICLRQQIHLLDLPKELLLDRIHIL
jgi:hypothetical protein